VIQQAQEQQTLVAAAAVEQPQEQTWPPLAVPAS
jgi:hypothetical protein